MATILSSGYAFVVLQGDGTDTYSFPFDYLKKEFIFVNINGVDQAFTWIDDNTIQLSSSPTASDKVEIYRSTSRDARLVDFQAQSTLTEKTLDLDSDQIFDIAQEAIDEVSKAASIDVSTGVVDFQGARLINVGDPIDPTDGANNSSRALIETYKIEAEAARDAAAISEANAATSETNAASSASSASSSEVNAATSESNAATSEANALIYRNEAEGFRDEAEVYAFNSLTSSLASQSSALDAATSATNAATSESNAALSEANAATSESNAATSEANAAASAANAATSESNAEDWANSIVGIDSTTGVSDADKYIKTDSLGQLDTSFLKRLPLTVTSLTSDLTAIGTAMNTTYPLASFNTTLTKGQYLIDISGILIECTTPSPKLVLARYGIVDSSNNFLSQIKNGSIHASTTGSTFRGLPGPFVIEIEDTTTVRPAVRWFAWTGGATISVARIRASSSFPSLVTFLKLRD